MSTDPVLLDVSDSIAIVTLNRPENRNSMTAEVLEGFSNAIREVGDRTDLRCLVVTGSGRSFCAGADFRAREGDGQAKPPHERQYATYSHFLSLLDLEIPIVAAMNGHAIGGGLGLALVCDLRVASADSRYGANFVRLGLHPGMASTYLLPRFMGVPKAVEFLLTGRIVTGAEAESAGLVHYAVPAERVLDKALELAREIASAAPLAVRWTKRSIYEGLDWKPRRAAYAEALLQSRSIETEDFREGVAALLKKRDPKFSGR